MLIESEKEFWYQPRTCVLGIDASTNVTGRVKVRTLVCWEPMEDSDSGFREHHSAIEFGLAQSRNARRTQHATASTVVRETLTFVNGNRCGRRGSE